MADETNEDSDSTYQGPKIRYSRDLARRTLEEKINEARDLLRDITPLRITTYSHLVEAKDKASMWDRMTEVSLSTGYTDSSIQDEYIGQYGFDDAYFEPKERDLQEEVEELRSFVNGRMQRLNAILRRLPSMPLEEMEEEEERQTRRARENREGDPDNRDIFVVHGRDDGAKDAVARCLERLGFNPIILKEKPNLGRVLIEKFEQNAMDIIYAVIILTPDDIGGLADTPHEHLEQRARQNVIFEIGFFVGAIQRARVCVLLKGHMPFPSDIEGIAWIPLDDRGAWQLLLANEIAESGIKVDLNKLRS